MALNLDLTGLQANKPPKHITNCIVTQLDPLNVGLTVLPRLIEIRLPGFDGAPANAMWYGIPATLSVGDSVRVRRDSSDTQVLTVEGSGEGAKSLANMVWLDEWTSQEYSQYNTVRDGDWTMVANKKTTDRAAPQSLGDPANLLPDVPTWNNNASVNIITSGLQLTAITALEVIVSYRVWIADVSGNTIYRIIIIDLINNTVDIGGAFNGSIAGSVGWLTIQTTNPPILVPGNEVQLLLSASNTSGTTVFVGPWALTASNNDDIPASGEVHRRLNRTTIRFNKTDDASADRTADLLSVLPGTILTSTNGGDYEIITVNDNLTNVLYDIQVNSEPTTGLQTWTFTIPTPASTDYVDLTNFWGLNPLVNATANGVLQLDNGTPTIDTNAYGFDIEAQEFAFSPDWDLLAFSGVSGGSGGGGGGVDTFVALLDTPANYAGASLYKVRVNAGATALEFIPDTPPASDSVPGIIQIATQSDQEAMTSPILAVTPARQQFHPSSAKVWGYMTFAAGTPTLQAAYNTTSITDNGPGNITVTIATNFSSVNYSIQTNAEDSTNNNSNTLYVGPALGSFTLIHVENAGTQTDPVSMSYAAWGYQ